MKKPAKRPKPASLAIGLDYSGLVQDVSDLLEAARSASPRIVDTSTAHLPIRSTPSNESDAAVPQTVSALFRFAGLPRAFPLTWSRSNPVIGRNRSPEQLADISFAERGWLGNARRPFAEKRPRLLDELNQVFAA